MTKTCIAIVALLGVFATNVVAAPMFGSFVAKNATAVTKVARQCFTTCTGSGNTRTCNTICY